MAKHQVFHLTAKQDFAGYRRGDHIEDEAEVNRILGGEHRPHVVKVAADIEPAPAPQPAPVAIAEPKAKSEK
jgi:hypothetical protein